MRGNRINIFPEKGKESEDPQQKLRKSIDSHERGKRNFRTFTSWIKEEKAKSQCALLSKVSVLLDDVTILIESLNGALNGTTDTPIAGIIGSVDKLLAMLSDVDGALPKLLGSEMSEQLTQTLGSLTEMLSDPNGAVPKLLGSEMSKSLTQILGSLVPIASNADKLVGDAAPELAELLVQVNQLLLQLQDTATGLNNNPLLRGGIPDRSNEASAPVRIRNGEF